MKMYGALIKHYTDRQTLLTLHVGAKKEQDQKDLLNLPLYRAMYFYIVMFSL